MNIWITGAGLKKPPFLLRALFIVNLTCLELVIKIINKPAKFGETLALGIWENTMIYIYKLMLSFWQTNSNLLGKFVQIIKDWIQPTSYIPRISMESLSKENRYKIRSATGS